MRLFVFQKIDSEVKKVVDEATKLAKADKEIGVHELFTDISVNPIDFNIRGVTTKQIFQHTTLKKAINL